MNEVPHWNVVQTLGRQGGEVYVDICMLYMLHIHDVSQNTYAAKRIETEDSVYFGSRVASSSV